MENPTENFDPIPTEVDETPMTKEEFDVMQANDFDIDDGAE